MMASLTSEAVIGSNAEVRGEPPAKDPSFQPAQTAPSSQAIGGSTGGHGDRPDDQVLELGGDLGPLVLPGARQLDHVRRPGVPKIHVGQQPLRLGVVQLFILSILIWVRERFGNSPTQLQDERNLPCVLDDAITQSSGGGGRRSPAGKPRRNVAGCGAPPSPPPPRPRP